MTKFKPVKYVKDSGQLPMIPWCDDIDVDDYVESETCLTCGVQLLDPFGRNYIIHDWKNCSNKKRVPHTYSKAPCPACEDKTGCNQTTEGL